MKLMTHPIALASYGENRWYEGKAGALLLSAVDSSPVASMPADGADIGAMLAFGRDVGGPALRALSFPQRGQLIRALADALGARKEELYELSYATGATRSDSAFDIEGGLGTLFVYASKAKKLPDTHILADGEREPLAKGDFLGQHVWTSRRGVAVHINAYNFPVWGMLEKLAPTLLAGMPVIVKPATTGAFLTHAAFRIMVESGLLPPGSVQLLLGSTGDLLDNLDGQDVVAFTGSAETAGKLRTHPAIIREGVRFTSEQDSLNASILGTDATAHSPEFDLFVKEVVREMTQKAGQKCTAIRRALVPEALADAAQNAIAARLAKMAIGNPRNETVRVGALAGLAQREDVRTRLAQLTSEARIVAGGGDVSPIDANAGTGAFFVPTLLRCDNPIGSRLVHEVEAFGPVSTLMPYADTEQAAAIARAGKGSLALSIFSNDLWAIGDLVSGAASSHGRILIVNRDNAGESTGHGAAMPQLIHGGPGRAGGGEELGGLIGMKSYMQRTALQGAAATLDGIVAL